MSKGPQQDQSKTVSPRQYFFLAEHASKAASDPITAWMRVLATEGSRAFGGHAVVGTLFYTLLIGEWDHAHGTIFFYATFLLFAGRALAGALSRDPDTHSSYDGRSILKAILERITGRPFSEIGVKGFGEMLLLAAAAVAVSPVSPGLSVCLGIAAACWAFRVAVFGLERAAVRRAMTDARADYQAATGNRPVANGGGRVARAGSPGRKLAKGAVAVCLLVVGWLAYTDQLGRQLATLPAAISSFAHDAEMQARWDDYRATHPNDPIGFEAYKAERRRADEMIRRIEDANRRVEQAEHERRARWRAWNRSYGY